MKAAVLVQTNEPLHIEDLVLDPPGEGEVMVRVAAVAICHSDVHLMQGSLPHDLPAVLGHEAAGIVEEVGAGVTSVAPGDRVVVSLIRSCGRCYFCAQGQSNLCDARVALDGETRLHRRDGRPVAQGIGVGAFAEYVVVHESQVVCVPVTLPLDRAALLACGVITGVGAAMNTAHVTPGSSVVVVGTGGVGLNAVQGAALCGANPIIAVDMLETKLAAARTFGATHGLVAGRDDLEAGVRALTAGRGADYVLVTVGSEQAALQGLSLLRRGGTLVLVGLPHLSATLPLPVSMFALSGYRLLGSFMGSTRLSLDVPRLAALYAQGRLKLDELITGRLPLERINEAVMALEEGRALRTVIVFD